MTVAMLLKDTSTGDSTRLVPISFMRIFNECWLPLGEKLGLETIPLYCGALVARQGETQPIIEDLLKLKAHLLQTPNEPYARYMIERIDGLIPVLEQIEADPNLEGWFG